jgi:hypothetical protein
VNDEVKSESKENEIMVTNDKAALAAQSGSMAKRWITCGIALISFAVGSLVTGYLTQVRQVSADNNRAFELMIYHTLPGKAQALESIFRDVSTLQEKHHINVVGYWVPNDDPEWENTFIYLVAQPSEKEAKKNWEALHADPEFPKYRQQASEIIEKREGVYKVDEVYMRPSDFSAMK